MTAVPDVPDVPYRIITQEQLDQGYDTYNWQTKKIKWKKYTILRHLPDGTYMVREPDPRLDFDRRGP